jgi:hypothetical protein
MGSRPAACTAVISCLPWSVKRTARAEPPNLRAATTRAANVHLHEHVGGVRAHFELIEGAHHCVGLLFSHSRAITFST